MRVRVRVRVRAGSTLKLCEQAKSFKKRSLAAIQQRFSEEQSDGDEDDDEAGFDKNAFHGQDSHREPPRVGRHLSATIDLWASFVLPTFFVLFLILEFSGVIVETFYKGNELEMEGLSVGLSRTDARGPMQSTDGRWYMNNTGITIEMYDLRDKSLSEEGRCFSNVQHLTAGDYHKNYLTFADQFSQAGRTCHADSHISRQETSERRAHPVSTEKGAGEHGHGGSTGAFKGDQKAMGETVYEEIHLLRQELAALQAKEKAWQEEHARRLAEEKGKQEVKQLKSEIDALRLRELDRAVGK
jgi:hypothetical protein